MADHIDSMAYVGEIPWHGLGTYLGDQDVDAQTMQRAAGLTWRVEKQPVTCNGHIIDDQFGIVRSDTGKPFPNTTVGRVFTPLQNDDLFAFGEALRDASGGEIKWHTAGGLMGGRKVWALGRVAGEIRVERRNGTVDRTAPFLLLHNAHDGKSPIVLAATTVRVVCWNTLSLALGESKETSYRIRHTRSADARMAEAAHGLGLAFDAYGAYAEFTQDLADTPMTGDSFAEFCAQLLTGKDDAREALAVVAESEGRARTLYENKGAELTHLFKRGTGNSGADRFDALNAVTEWIDQSRGRLATYKRNAERMEKAFVASQFGSGSDLKARAVALLSR